MQEKVKRKSRARPRLPTLRDVAAHAGVSPMTVSRVINGETTVRPEARARVEVAITALGYAPNVAARELAGTREIRIAILFCKPSAYISEFLFGGVEGIQRSKVQVILEKCADDGDAESCLRRLAATGVDGILLAPPLGDAERVLDAVAELALPTVVVSSDRVRDNLSSVSVDDYAAAREMTAYLLSLGHRRIGFIEGDPHQHASRHRLAGYRDALAAAGADTAGDLVVPGRFSYRSGLDAAGRLLALDEPPTAIFASNDAMAAATISVAHMRGLDVPGDLTVCGYDDTAFAVTTWPELTTIRQPIANLSREAGELLVRKVRARRAGRKEPSRHVVLAHTLVRRQSDAGPRASHAGPGPRS